MSYSVKIFQDNVTITLTITSKDWDKLIDNLGLNIGLYFTKEQVVNANFPMPLLFEIANNTYTDTDQYEQIVDHLALKYIGMRCPCYSDSKEIMDEFKQKAKIKGITK